MIKEINENCGVIDVIFANNKIYYSKYSSDDVELNKPDNYHNCY